MVIEVRLEGALERFRAERQRHFSIALPSGSTVRNLIDASGIPWDMVGVAAVNGLHAEDDQVLTDGDRIILLAPIEGG